MKRMPITILWILSLVFYLSLSGVSASGVDIDRMTKEQLQKKLVDGDIVVVDARSGRDWKSSEFKIKGAIRPGKDIVKWAEAYPKDTIFVLYCA